jgi:hypothetical protein
VVRRRGADVIMWLRGTVAPFDPSGDPSLSWRIAFGTGCTDTYALGCTGDSHGNARCRAAGGQALREP